MVVILYYLPTCLIMLGFSISTLIYTLKNRKEKIKKHLFWNEILIGLLFLNAGILFPFAYQYHSINLPIETLNFLWLTTSLFISIEMGIWFYYLIYNTIISKKNPEIMAERDYVKFCENFNKNWIFDFNTDLKRKLLHLFTVSIIFFFWSLGTILDSIGYLAKWGLDNYSFSLWLIITIGYGFVIMFQTADLVRLNYFYALPKWAKNWYCKQMRNSELDTFISSTPMVLAFVFFVFAPFPIFAAVSLITAGSDAMAALIGKKFGKHRFKKNSKKTLEGFIAGGLTTFFIVLIISLIFHNLLPQNVAFIKIFLMAIVSTIIFLLIDGFSTDINDNILNPILTGLGLWIVLLI